MEGPDVGELDVVVELELDEPDRGADPEPKPPPNPPPKPPRDLAPEIVERFTPCLERHWR